MTSLDDEDGILVRANLFVVEDYPSTEISNSSTIPEVGGMYEEICAKVLVVEDAYALTVSVESGSTPPLPPPKGMVKEIMIMDSGANRNVHSNIKSALSYYQQPLKISTASGSKDLSSEGVGVMNLHTSSGTPIKGFDRVIFCKKVAENLCSVGELCNAGYICVFDEKKVTLYEKNDFSVSGKIFTSDFRQPRTGLYPITFYRKQDNEVQDVSAKKIPAVVDSLTLSSKNFYLVSIADLPSLIPDAPIPTIHLAKSYRMPNLSELDRYHAKFGDVGIKYMKRCMPHLKIPKQYRCDICIDGKKNTQVWAQSV